MTTRDEVAEPHVSGSIKLFFWVWVALVIMTGLETLLAYEDLALLLMLTLLMGLSVIKSGFILSYFMHLRFERMGLFLITVPVLVLCICIILAFFYPDSFRLLHMQAH